mgnify:CR=1 FL=1
MVEVYTAVSDASALQLLPLAWVTASTTAGLQTGVAFNGYQGATYNGVYLYVPSTGSVYSLYTASPIWVPRGNAVVEPLTNTLIYSGSPYLGSVFLLNLNSLSASVFSTGYAYLGLVNIWDAPPQIGTGTTPNQFFSHFASSNGSLYQVIMGWSASGSTMTLFGPNLQGPYAGVSNVVVLTTALGYPLEANIAGTWVVAFNFYHAITYESGGSYYVFLGYWYAGWSTPNSTVTYGPFASPYYVALGNMGSVFAWAIPTGGSVFYVASLVSDPWGSKFSGFSAAGSQQVTLTFVPQYYDVFVYGNYAVFLFSDPSTGSGAIYILDVSVGSLYDIATFTNVASMYFGTADPYGRVWFTLVNKTGGASLMYLQFDSPISIASVWYSVSPVLQGSIFAIYASLLYPGTGSPASNITLQNFVYAGANAGNVPVMAPLNNVWETYNLGQLTATTNASGIASAWTWTLYWWQGSLYLVLMYAGQ